MFQGLSTALSKQRQTSDQHMFGTRTLNPQKVQDLLTQPGLQILDGIALHMLDAFV